MLTYNGKGNEFAFVNTKKEVMSEMDINTLIHYVCVCAQRG